MKVPHMMPIRTILTSHAKRIFSDNVTCLGTNKCCSNRSHLSGCFKCSSLLACKAARVQLSFVCQLVFPADTLQLPSICVLPTAFKTFSSNGLGILTGRSWNFSDISSDITGPPAHESTSLNVNKANGMLTSHVKRIFSDYVTCFGKNNSCSNRSHLPQCFIKALRFLLAWLLCFYTEIPRIFFWKAIFATSPIVPAVTIHNFPWKMRVETCPLSFQYGILPSSLCLEARSLCVVCGLLAMFRNRKSLFGNPHISPFNILSCSACWSKKQDAGMETSHAKRIFSDYVTCFGKNNSCSNRSHLPQCFIKALRFLLAWLLCFYTEIPRIFFWKAIFATSPIVPAVIIHTLPWKMRVETCPLSFQYGILPGSFPFRAWCGDFQFRGCISKKTLSSKRGLLTGTSWNWRVCPLHAWR